jgi:uncharacterized Zn finger protein
MEIDTTCPSCGEPVTLVIDITAGRRQTYVEDCWVCCRPMQVAVVVHTRDDVDVDVSSIEQ